ncbi:MULTISPECIES: fumarylacetoacetate hydrolase family protein [unclassified Sphingobium]|uniref:fumarylacetoacetate hydrolase family protein n=1 Tax=unclassified Sphingobium TaxID=2611147 RepID=UPI00222494CB|nr:MULTISPECIES: fumarylacetoacetate hydrolase family protein [unclassified Sphingobium]MCW2394024.1 2-keto-4-pentenoate hydratase/2-oxohepta-3-ene-1,7-dioic acid hydratase in catechol pathway [Sphingobium sp. B8D3B]MCW2417538.1 2-keto-4-pentenoate hydratase/2-oxohepta-3-ene-1,7-dioic acid hydratase in catechol pathway [Sphingobium sp. B8D3C]
MQPEGTIFDLSEYYADTHEVFDDWDIALDRLGEIAAKGGETGIRFETVEILPALKHPNILGAGSNYKQHVAEMMTNNKFNQHNRQPGESDEDFFKRNYAEVARRATEGMPYFWTGLHSALSGANDDIILPLIGEHMEWELELGAVVARTGRYLPPEEAESLIAGYVMVNDLGCVDEFRRTDIKFGYDWVSKNQPNHYPTGPFIVPKQFIDWRDAQIVLKVNGKTMQDWPASDMIFSPAQILSYASERIKLLPGDLLITGSPPGNAGSHGGCWLKAGDVVESEITGLGRQRNEVVPEDAQGRKPTYGPFITEW